LPGLPSRCGRRAAIGLAALAACVFVVQPAYAATLDDVKSRGTVNCAVTPNDSGFAKIDTQGWRGLGIDLCRAVAAATLGDPSRVRFHPYKSNHAVDALLAGRVDLMANGLYLAASPEGTIDLPVVAYYDGLGFMVRKALGVKSAKELDGAAVCVNVGTRSEPDLDNFFRSNNMGYKPVPIETSNEVFAAYANGRCDALALLRTSLLAARKRMPRPDDHAILPELATLEPIGPAVRHGDDRWADIIRWVVNSMILAEEHGITASNVERMRSSSRKPAIRRLLGTEGPLGKYLGLNSSFAYDIIRSVGNYGEIFSRNLGRASPYKEPRGVNQLWTKGGILYAPPFR
jgi:general L-amino acid transport system substrate-binding protein